MNPATGKCNQLEQVAVYALQALPPQEARSLELHIESCPECHEELRSMRSVVDSFSAWPTDVLRPSTSLWDRLAHRIAEENGTTPLIAPDQPVAKPEWEEVAPGIFCKLLATDGKSHSVSMLVRLAPGVEYPPHTHAGVEELHLLDGELWIDDRKLFPGDYNRGEPGTGDKRVWSETGCTCVLITSTRDVLS
jgi:anti-sigma factor ChrR (cupin superfamily)